MPVPRLLTVAALLFGQFIVPAHAADAQNPEACLSKAEQRAAVAANQAMPLAQAIKILREHRKYSEVVRAQICRREGKLVYVLTLLGRSGKVVSATIDAINGEYNTR